MFPRREDIKNIVVILGSSRSGSSFLFNQLSRLENIISPQGEETPFYRLEDIGWIRTLQDSDELAPENVSEAQLDGVFYNLACDATVPRSLTQADSLDLYLQRNTRRLGFQWPQISPIKIKTVLSEIVKLPQEQQLVELKNKMISLGADGNFYDGSALPARGPLPFRFLEEPPYVFPKTCASPTEEDWQTHSLLLKTSTNAYRIPLLKKMFPHAQFRWILLSRNPLASINGLRDGWLSPWFQSHNLSGICDLKIPGLQSSWWKFDAPPGWADHTDRPLEDVCAFQWTSAYRSIFKSLSSENMTLPVRYEDIASEVSRDEAFKKIVSFINPDRPPTLDRFDFSKKVMATHLSGYLPSPQRWRLHKETFLPLKDFPQLNETADELGYNLSKELT
jgi:hypothetical protein